MNGKLHPILVGGALVASALTAAPAHAADRVIASAPPGLLSEVHAHGGNVVWGVARGYDEPETTSDYFVRDARGTRHHDQHGPEGPRPTRRERLPQGRQDH